MDIFNTTNGNKFFRLSGYIVISVSIFFCWEYVLAQTTVTIPANATLETLEKLAKELPEGASGKKGESQDAEVDKLNLRPVIEFKTEKKKSSFQDYYRQKKKEQEGPFLEKEMLEAGISGGGTLMLPPLDLKGLVWGTDTPQAIINGKVLKIGDTIDEVKIVTIDKTGVGVLFQGKTAKVASPSKSYFINDTVVVSEGGKK